MKVMFENSRMIVSLADEGTDHPSVNVELKHSGPRNNVGVNVGVASDGKSLKVLSNVKTEMISDGLNQVKVREEA